MDDIRTLVERAIVNSPYGRLLGVVCEKVEPDRIAVRLPFRADVTTIGDMVHGAAVARATATYKLSAPKPRAS